MLRETGAMRVLLTGASGQLGCYVVRQWRPDCGHLVAWSGSRAGRVGAVELHPIDLTRRDDVWRALECTQPDVILHTAAVSKPEAVLQNPARGWLVNRDATRTLVAWAGQYDRRLIFTSTDLVFDGQRGQYAETDPTSPVVEYGRTKVAAEQAVLTLDRGVVARVCLLFGPSLRGLPTFFDQALADIRKGTPRAFFEDEYRTPLDLGTAAAALIQLCQTTESGIVHLAGPERLSRFELMGRVAAALGLDAELVQANRIGDRPWPEPRPVDVSLRSTRLAAWLPGLVRPTVEEVARSW